MRVLLTNDDGYQSEGIHALARAFARVADVLVAAPHHNRSASGHSITLHKPLRIFPVEIPGAKVTAWATTGTPADCVVLALYDLLPVHPDIVVSGINVGLNIGRDLTYSGTVSGALEAAIIGVPSIAVSVDAGTPQRFDVAARFAVILAEHVVAHGVPAETILNVNVPNLPAEAIREVAITRQGDRRYVSSLEKRIDPRGEPYYWLSGSRATVEEQAGTDSHALARGAISVTPVHTDMTLPTLLARLREWELARALGKESESR